MVMMAKTDILAIKNFVPYIQCTTPSFLLVLCDVRGFSESERARYKKKCGRETYSTQNEGN
jgi:hypothetical protein